MSKLSDLLATVEADFKAVEHGVVIGLHKLRVADDNVAPLAQSALALIPSAAPALAVFVAQKAVVDAADDFVNQAGSGAPAALLTAIENLKASISKTGTQTAK